MKRSPMPARKTPMRRGPGPRSRGIADAVAKHPAGGRAVERAAEKRAAAAELARNRELAFKRDGHQCRLIALDRTHMCEGPLVGHHRVLRSQGGTHDVENLVTLCDRAHRWVHDNPARARELGLYGHPKENHE